MKADKKGHVPDRARAGSGTSGIYANAARLEERRGRRMCWPNARASRRPSKSLDGVSPRTRDGRFFGGMSDAYTISINIRNGVEVWRE